MADQTTLDNAEFAAALAALRPRAASLDRDELFYRAGRVSGAPGTGRHLWRRLVVTAAGWITAAVFSGLWYVRPAVVTVVEAPSAPPPVDMRVVERPPVPEMPVVDQQEQPDHTQPSHPGRSLADQPVTRFGFDNFGQRRVSLIGAFTNSESNHPSGSVAEGHQRPSERATYAELMRQYLPRPNDFQRGPFAPPQSVDTGDRT